MNPTTPATWRILEVPGEVIALQAALNGWYSPEQVGYDACTQVPEYQLFQGEIKPPKGRTFGRCLVRAL